MDTDADMWDYTLNLTLAAYLHRKPNRQVRNMAKRYKRETSNPANKRTLSRVIKSSEPALMVKMVYDDLIS